MSKVHMYVYMYVHVCMYACCVHHINLLGYIEVHTLQSKTKDHA